MTKNRKKIIIILILIALYLLFCGIIFLSPKGKKEKYEMTYSETKEIKMCKSNKCYFSDPQIYHIIKQNSPYKKVNSEIKKINAQTNNYYDDVRKSNISNECLTNKDIYNHPISIESSFFYSKQNDKYISIFVTRNYYDLCTDNYKKIEAQGFNYDIYHDKMLTQKEFKKIFNISESAIQSAIESNLSFINSGSNSNYEYSQVNESILYYIDDSRIGVLYYLPQLKYYSNVIIYI